MTNTPPPRRSLCPLCRAPTIHEFRPFCSKRCRDRDFLGWANESYTLPGAPADEDALDQAAQKNHGRGVDNRDQD